MAYSTGLPAARTAATKSRLWRMNSSQDVARLRFVDEALHVFLDQEAVLLQLPRCFRDRLHIAVVVLVAFLERLARVAARLALGLGAREWDVLAVRFAAVGPAELVAAQRPAGGGGGRRLHARHAHPGDLVAVLVDLGDEDLVRGPSDDRLRVIADDAVVEGAAEVEEVAGGDHAGVQHAWNA